MTRLDSTRLNWTTLFILNLKIRDSRFEIRGPGHVSQVKSISDGFDSRGEMTDSRPLGRAQPAELGVMENSTDMEGRGGIGGKRVNKRELWDLESACVPAGGIDSLF